MKKFFAYIKTRPLALASVILLALLYLAMIFADFVAPYPATRTFEENTFHPANLRVAKNGLVAKEAKTISMINWKYAFVKGAEHKVHFFAKGFPYKLFGLIPCDRHLFGTSGGPRHVQPNGLRKPHLAYNRLCGHSGEPFACDNLWRRRRLLRRKDRLGHHALRRIYFSCWFRRYT